MKQNLLLVLFTTAVFSVTAQTDSTSPAKSTSPRRATIFTNDGKKIDGWFYKTGDDKIYILPTNGKAVLPAGNTAIEIDKGFYSIDASQINTIALKKKNGGLKGALIGLGIGAALGAIAGFVSGDDPVIQSTGNPYADPFISLGNAFAFTAGEKALALGAVGGLTGALIGGIIGAVAKKTFIIGGNKDVYHNTRAILNRLAIVKF